MGALPLTGQAAQGVCLLAIKLPFSLSFPFSVCAQVPAPSCGGSEHSSRVLGGMRLWVCPDLHTLPEARHFLDFAELRIYKSDNSSFYFVISHGRNSMHR